MNEWMNGKHYLNSRSSWQLIYRMYYSIVSKYYEFCMRHKLEWKYKWKYKWKWKYKKIKKNIDKLKWRNNQQNSKIIWKNIEQKIVEFVRK